MRKIQELRGGSSNRAFHPVNGRLACGSMVHFIFFFTKMLHFVQHFCEKEWNLLPCRRRIGPVVPADACQVNDRVTCVK
jgi:hypothetical protein